MAQLRSVKAPTNALVPDGEDGSLEEEEETKTFLFQYLARRAQNDQDMLRNNSDVIQRCGEEQAARSTAGTDSTDAATNVACKLADLGESRLPCQALSCLLAGVNSLPLGLLCRFGVSVLTREVFLFGREGVESEVL